MPKRRRFRDSAQPDRPPAASQSETPAARPLVRGRLFALLAVAALLSSGWWGVRALRNAETRAAIAALEPVSPSVPEDQPERKEAMEVADRLLRDYSDSPEALYARGTLLARHGFNDEAVKSWRACLKLVPDLAPAYERLGIEAFQRGDRDEAVELLRKAIELDPQSPAAGLYLGETLNSLGRMEEAIPVLEQFITVAPRFPEPYFQLGQAYMYLEDYKRAKQYHEAALRQDPGFAQAYYGLAQACERLGEADRARECRENYRAMIDQSRMAEQTRVRQHQGEAEVRQSLANAYLTAAKILMAHGDEQEAREYWSRAAAIDPRATSPGGSEEKADPLWRRPAAAGR